MLFYTLVAIVLGILLGHFFNMKGLSNLTIPIVFVMIYPMRVNLSLSSLKKIKESKKPLIQALILNFIFAPALMYLLTTLFATSPQMKLALMLLSIAPASSMGLGYIGIAEGHLITGAIIVALAFMMAVVALSLPEMVILRKVLKPKLLGIYVTIVTIGILFTGYLFNLII